MTDLTLDRTEEEDGALVGHLSGSMDARNHDDLRTILEDLTGREPERLVLELEGVDRIDSKGIGTLMVASGELEDRGGELRLRGARPEVRTVMELIGLDTLLEEDGEDGS